MSGPFNAYYYSFTATGDPGVDAVLQAVAHAGKAFHHTERWADDDYGTPQADLIQNAATKAADDHLAAIREAEDRGAQRAVTRIGQWAENSPVGGKTYAKGVTDERDRIRERIEAVEFPVADWITREGAERALEVYRMDVLAAMEEHSR